MSFKRLNHTKIRNFPCFSSNLLKKLQKKPRLPLFSKSRIYRIHQIAARGKPAIGDGVLWISPCKRGEAEAQLGESHSRSTEPRRVGCGKPPQVRTCHPWYTRCTIILRQAQFFFGEADFFSAKRLFFRNGEGGEWRASRVTVGVTAKDNGEACFPLDFGFTHTIGRQPSPPHRGDFLFVSCHISSHLWVACHNRTSPMASLPLAAIW